MTQRRKNELRPQDQYDESDKEKKRIKQYH